MLTELEGAILSDIYYRRRDTAFQVRRAFAASPSLEWKGSAGAVYPAIQRLERNGLILATATTDGRATRKLSVTAAGAQALHDWACDPERATSVGVDPFRLRAGIWSTLDAVRRAEAVRAIRQKLAESIVALEAYSRLNDAIEQASVDLSIRLQRARLEWLDDQLKDQLHP